jgi:DNA-3-methyladenine glycosylase
MQSLKPISSFQNSKDTSHIILPLSFYLREDVVQVAKDLIGKVIVSNSGNKRTAGIICETEAYAGALDKASHAYSNRRTKRTEVMFHAGGIAYVYLCYGIHYLFNVVCADENIAHAVLIRNIVPIEGITTIKKRRGKRDEKKLTTGPGTLCQALNITKHHNGISLLGPEIWIEDRDIKVPLENITITKRIGVDYAENDALLPYRFLCEF